MAIPIVRPGQGGEPPRKRPENGGREALPPIKMGRSDATPAPKKQPQAPQAENRPRRSEEKPQSSSSSSQRPRPSTAQRAQKPREDAPRKRAATREEYLSQQGGAPKKQAPQGGQRAARPTGKNPSSNTTQRAKRPTRPVPLEKEDNPQLQRAEQRQSPKGDWIVDNKTGVKHRVLPKTEWDPESPGYSVSHIEDSYDANYDLDSMAKDFLGHLRVAPSKKELAELQAEKEAMRRQQEEAYHELHDGEDEDEEYDYYDED